MSSLAKRVQRGRRNLRKDRDETDPLDVEESSPSRAAKRRKRTRSSDPAEANNPPSATAVSRAYHANQSTEGDDDHVISQVTQQLKCQPVKASKDHANTIHEANRDGVKAYAKVAAQDWTFYITDLAVNIGREPEPSPQDDDEGEETNVHIDLGPSKMVSRDHASICFNSKDETWVLHIKGRNGAKVDGKSLKSRDLHPLSSGAVIEIANVEMMFVLPSEISPLHIHPAFLQRSGLSANIAKANAFPQQPMIAPTLAEYRKPGTPSSSQRRAASKIKSPSVTTPAVMVGAHGVDLSQDDNQHIKPQFSYAQMITQAILNSVDGKLNLNGIYTFIMKSYSYYRHQQAAGWQNSIRHNLSLNKSFDKVARSTDEPGKGMKWQIVPEAREEMVKNAYKIGRGGHRGSSAPSSPNQLNYITQGPKEMAARESASGRNRRASPLISPSPRSTLRTAQSTPERSSNRLKGRNAASTADGSPLPRHRKSTRLAPDSSYPNFNIHSPTLTSSFLQDDGVSFVTPAPPRIHPKLAPPSTAQRPSQHMPTSSPAPFWKYADISSTPLRPSAAYEFSPSKLAEGLPSQSSSPLRASKSPPSSPSKPQKLAAEENKTADYEGIDDAEEDQGFDLTRGFQSIGSYHAPVGRGLSVTSALKGKS